jgi:steroid delta-isomerase-like uncharacterized protein
MSLTTNKQIVQRIYDELINQENPVVIDEVFAANVIVHDPFLDDAQGVAAFRQLLGLFDSAFPHHRVQINALIAEGEYVVVLHTHTATQRGPFMGLPPTGRTVVVNGLELFRLEDGKVVEFWRKDDDASLLMQLGILPAPQPA